ncbi:acryloyl-CoA reductase [Paenibacillus terrigena]|uniref:acrylyl-CoA reductase family protein n=1 Tax=Paenibacillus terrigena TaxID=369333 RepID=UPI0028D19E5C|nr:acryloyl-CoA reductase [Paenibacillus terrigena]
MTRFQAFVVDKQDEEVITQVKTLTMEDLPAGDVTIRAAYSSVNYKDGLATLLNGGIVNQYPFIPGIDVAGTVVESKDERFEEGDFVLVTGYGLGVSHFGGYSEYIRVPGDWIVHLPEGITLKESMALGTAGFTAALSIHKLEQHGLRPDQGEVLVTGATGGVGSLAVAMLSKIGYHVVASSGKTEEHDFLRKLGAKEILSREDVSPEQIRPLSKARWAAVVDPVGGNTLAHALSTTKYGGAIAVSGMIGGAGFPGNVYPFILRGVQLIGIDSVYCPMDERIAIWKRLGSDLKPDLLLEEIGRVTTLAHLSHELKIILQGKQRGRLIVAL